MPAKTSGMHERSKTGPFPHLSVELDEDISPIPVQTRNAYSEIRLRSLVLRAIGPGRDAGRDQSRLRLPINLRLLSVEARRGTEDVGIQRGRAGQVGDRRVRDMRCRRPGRLL